MTEFWEPSAADLKALVETHPASALKNQERAHNYLFHGIFNLKTGLYAKGRQRANIWYRNKDGSLGRKKTTLSRREWIERYFRIRDADEQIVPLILNAPQRKLEATILKMQRAGVPVRVVILKSRKLGFTTYIEAVIAHEALRRENFQGLIISDIDERAELTLSITNIGLSNIPKTEGQPWKFKYDSDAAYFMQWEAPIQSSISISSAKREAAGRGGTPSALHGNETAYWANAERTAAGALASLPERPHTLGFSESTANSDTGWFPDQFWGAWKLRDVPLNKRGLGLSWVALFFAYFEHPEAFWTKMHGVDELPKEVADEISASLTDEEKWVLQQTYYSRWTPESPWGVRAGNDGPVPCRRGVGPQRVTLDQLAWFRKKLNGPECNGDINTANREYPSRPEVAFWSSGNPVFSQEIILELLAKAKKPIWEGYVAGTEHSAVA